jgi:hypothetical protein
VIGDVREEQGEILSAPGRIFDRRGNCTMDARNFVNDLQGYQTVKTAAGIAPLVRNLDPRGPLRSTNANSAAACERCNLTQPCDAGPPSRDRSLVP